MDVLDVDDFLHVYTIHVHTTKQEPLLVSLMYSSVLNHKSLEAAVAFHMATKLATPSLIGTQIEALFLQCFEVRGLDDGWRIF
jgi:hypothetical protein